MHSHLESLGYPKNKSNDRPKCDQIRNFINSKSEMKLNEIGPKTCSSHMNWKYVIANLLEILRIYDSDSTVTMRLDKVTKKKTNIRMTNGVKETFGTLNIKIIIIEKNIEEKLNNN